MTKTTSGWRRALTPLAAVALSVPIALLAFAPAKAGITSCYQGSYCVYEGKISSVYANSTGLILLYFTDGIDTAMFNAAGVTGISSYEAAAYQIDPANPQSQAFADRLFSTALTAKLQGRNVMLFLWGGGAIGRPMADRIWLQ